MNKPGPEHLQALRSIREYVHSRTLARYPVSTARRRLGLIGMVLLVTATAAYTLSTSDEAIRSRALAFLQNATPGGVEIEVGGAAFRMFEGITLHDVRVFVPFDPRVDPSAEGDRSKRLVFSAATLQLVHDPWQLLIGNLRVKRVLAVQPEIVLARNVLTGMRNWELLYDPDRERRATAPKQRPIVTIRSARARVVSIAPDGTYVDSTQLLDADLRPSRQSDSGYDIEIRQYLAPIGRATVHFDPAQGMVENSPFVATETVKLQLPATLQRLFEHLKLNGDVRLDRYVFERDPKSETDARIELRNVQCEIPLWLLCGRAAAPSADDPLEADLLLPIARFVDVDGRIELLGDRVEIDVQCSMNGAPCFVQGALIRPGNDAEFKQWGVDLRITATGLPAPEGAVRRRVLADPHSPDAIHEFINDYRPHGPLDVDLHFTRAIQAPGTVRMDGTIKPQGCVGTARWFPYTLKDVHGLVRFDGKFVHLENLNGVHGSGFVTIDGLIDRRTHYSTLDLDIRAYNIPLDTQLFMSMSDRYKGVWERFLPYGTANIHTILHRTGGPRCRPRPRLEKQILVDLRDLMAVFRPYPYRIEYVDGRLVVDEDRILLHDITGFANGAPILLDGYALLDPTRNPEIDMRLQATGLALDARVAAAFGGPDGPLARFNPRGFIDIIGGLTRREMDDALRWNLHIDARDLDMRHVDFPYALANVTADVDVGHDIVRINSIAGRHGETDVRATGTWRRSESGGDHVEFIIATPRIALDQDLYTALPPAVRKIWDMLAPSGTVRVETRHTITGPDEARLHRHQTTIDPLTAAIRFSRFPLPVTALTGSIVVTDRDVTIRNVTGAIGAGRISIDGVIQLDAPGLRGRLAVSATNFDLTPELLEALPIGIGRWLKNAKPAGRMSINLTQLSFEADATGALRWQIEGAADLHALAMELGMQLQDVDGTLRGTAVIEAMGKCAFDARAEFSWLQLGDWPLENVRGRFLSEPSLGAVLVRDAVARLYGGDVTGDVSIFFNADTSEYKLSLLFRDVQLAEYLAAQRRRGPRPETRADVADARGMLEGNFSLQGRTGHRPYREGAGTIYIRQAQVWKLPFALAIFQVLNLTPDENVFHDGRVELFLTDDKLILHEIDLQGKAMAFIGGGTLNLGTRSLDLRLLAASPTRVQVPILTEIVEGICEVMELRITGTVDRPHIRPEPMRQTRDVFDTLFPEIPQRRAP